MQYREPFGLPATFGIRQSDMLIYMVFQVMCCGFVPICDILIYHHLELYFGFKIYDYLVYSRYRFLQREARWKPFEDTLDECIEEGLRRLDQVCFSSQYFLMIGVMASGIAYSLIAMQMWLHPGNGYSPFSDPAFIPITCIMIFFYWLMVKMIMWGVNLFRVYRIKHEDTSWHIQMKEEDELDIPGWEDVKGASHEAFVMNQRITSDTFRFKFLNYNKTWLINQLPTLLTPRTLRRSRPYLINQFARIINARRDDISDDDEKDGAQHFKPVALSSSSRNIIRWWLGKARRRLRLRSIVDPLIRRARGMECEQCLSRKQLQVEYEIDTDKMAEMYDKTYPGDEEVDQIQWKSFWMDNQRYHTICLACLARRKELSVNNALRGQDLTLLEDQQEEYPDWGPIFLTAASKAILLNWYRKAQRLRQGKKGAIKRDRILKAVSDDEGDDVPPEWTRMVQNISDSTKALAIKWMRTARARLQHKAGKGVSLREADLKKQMEEQQSRIPSSAGESFRSGKKSKEARK